MDSDSHFHPRIDVDGRMVDEGIADLMRTIWGFGLRTMNCCQGGPDYPLTHAWIQFWDLEDGVKFLEATGYLSEWSYGDDVRMYLTKPVLPQAPSSPVVMMNYLLLPQITNQWKEGTAKPPESAEKG